jgi:RNA polymerase sigma-70 factor (ECF subfamily)
MMHTCANQVRILGYSTVVSLLERIARGERAAFAQCVEQYGDLVWSLSRRMAKNNADAEDGAQEIFVSIWKKAARFDAARGTEVAFIATLARRALIDRHRTQKRHSAEVVMNEMDGPWSAIDDARGEISSDAVQAAAAMKKLKPEQQRVIALAVWEGLSQNEIAGVTGMPLGTVKSLMRRGLLSIREMLGGELKS